MREIYWIARLFCLALLLGLRLRIVSIFDKNDRDIRSSYQYVNYWLFQFLDDFCRSFWAFGFRILIEIPLGLFQENLHQFQFFLAVLSIIAAQSLNSFIFSELVQYLHSLCNCLFRIDFVWSFLLDWRLFSPGS